MKRREFVGTLAAVAAAGPLRGLRFETTHLSKVGLQLYTVRDLMKSDFEGTIAKVAGVGYKELEFAGYFDHTPAQVRALLDHHGLTSPSSHVPYEMIDQGWDKILEACHVVGHQWATVAWVPPEQRKTVDDWKHIAAQFNKAGAACKQAGIRFAYHNHNMEFQAVDGQLPMDILVANTDPALVDFEMDLFWIIFGGGDPLAYFAKTPGRFPLVHVKDMAPKPTPTVGPEVVMRDVGKGSIDWKGIFAHSSQAGITHAFVEHDQPGNAIASITASYEYLKQLEF